MFILTIFGDAKASLDNNNLEKKYTLQKKLTKIFFKHVDKKILPHFYEKRFNRKKLAKNQGEVVIFCYFFAIRFISQVTLLI